MRLSIVHMPETNTGRGRRRLSAVGTLDKPKTSEQRAAKPITSQLENHRDRAYIAWGTRKIQQQMVGGIAGGGDRRRTQNKKTKGRIWMKPPKISTHVERQDNQIYESHTPEIPSKDKNETKGKRQRGRGREEAVWAKDIK